MKFSVPNITLFSLLIGSGVGMGGYAMYHHRGYASSRTLPSAPDPEMAENEEMERTSSSTLEAPEGAVPLEAPRLPEAMADTAVTRFPVKLTTQQGMDAKDHQTMDLRDPENLKTEACLLYTSDAADE